MSAKASLKPKSFPPYPNQLQPSNNEQDDNPPAPGPEEKTINSTERINSTSVAFFKNDLKNDKNDDPPSFNSIQKGDNEETDKTDSISIPLIQKGNADFNLTPGRTFVYCSIDGIGGLRQTSTAAQSISLLSHASSNASNITGAAIPFGLLITGLLSMGTAAFWTLPDSSQALTEAQKELEAAEKALETATDKEESKKVVMEAKHAVEISRLGLANHSLYFSMGASQTASGIVSMLSPETAHVLHYSPILTGHAANIAGLATGVALGAIYVARGGVMLTRAVKSYCLVRDFHDEFKKGFENSGSKGQTDGIHAATGFMEKAKVKGQPYLDRRIDQSCLRKTDEKGNYLGTYTEKGFQNPEGEITKYSSDSEKIEYLKRVDKGIYTEKLKHEVAITIAIAMIIGGVLAIVLSVMTGGIAALIIGLVSAIFFMSMEYIFMTYDSSSLFEWLRDRLYKEPEWAISSKPAEINLSISDPQNGETV